MTGDKPNLSNLRIFGSRVYVKKPGKHKAKLDNHTYNGIFVGFTATDKNINYIDESNSTVKMGTHALFDEAHFTVPASQALQRLGYTNFDSEYKDGKFIPDNALRVKLHTSTAVVPTQSTSGSIDLDIHYSRPQVTIPSQHMVTLETDISIQPPKGTYVRIAPQSGLAHKHQLHVLAGVIDSDYRGTIKVMLQNLGPDPVTITPGQRIAQMICEQAQTPDVIVSEELAPTKRNTSGFGSTKTSIPLSNHIKTNIIPFDTSELLHEPDNTSPHVIDSALIHNMTTVIEPPVNVYLTDDPFDNLVTIDVKTFGHHPTLGIVLQQNKSFGNRYQLQDCLSSTPSARIHRWRSTLRHAVPVKINDQPINNKQDFKTLIRQARDKDDQSVQITFATVQNLALHPQLHIPMMYHDQLNILAQHLKSIKDDFDTKHAAHKQYVNSLTASIATLTSTKKIKKLTREILKSQDDWFEWEASERKQLNQYEAQHMFSKPMPIPPGANCLPFIWTYILKTCGTKKARGVCNGSPRMKGTVTMGETYAASLNHVPSRIFWALTAIHNNIVIGANASNAFAEAPAPTAPLYMSLDQQFHSWWRSKGRQDLPPPNTA